MSQPGPFYDGKVHVLTDKCSTCVFRPKNLMHLPPGRLQGMVEGSVEGGGVITCHQTLPYGEYEAEPAVCRGFFDSHGDRVQGVRMAKAMDLIEEVEPPTKKKGVQDAQAAAQEGA